MANSQPKFNFGNTAETSGSSNPASTSSNGGTGSLFGSTSNSAAPPGSTLFGNLNSTSGGSQPTSLFGGGGGSSSPAQAPPLFGGQSSGGNAFGGGANSTSTGFSFPTSNTAPALGNNSAPNNTSAPTPPGQTTASNLFGGEGGGEGGRGGGGANSSGTNIFGGLGSNNTNSVPTGSTTPATNKSGTGFSFGNSTTPAGPPPATNPAGSSGNAFSFNKPQQPSALFGNPQATQTSAQQMPPPPAPTNLFGAGGGQAASNPFGSANTSNASPTTSTAAPSGNLFGSAGPGGGSSMFSNNKDSQAGKDLFPNMNKPQENVSTAASNNAAGSTPSTNIFGQQGQPNKDSEPAKTSNFFSFPTQGSQGDAASKEASTPSLFGAIGGVSSPKPDTKPDTKPTSSFFPPAAVSTTQAVPSPNISAATTTTKPSLFSGLGTSSTGAQGTSSSSPASGPSLFASMGKPAQQTSSSSLAIPNTKDTPASAPTSTTGTTVPAPSAPQSTETAAAPAPMAGTSTATLGTSTSGPAPPAQSRLKNKSMDEIITRWATDLSKYQKEFQSQAERVATWDRMLVENGDKIQKLYASTFEAERASAEVERQLTAVEGQQDELSGWLDRYEREVENMITRQVGQGEGLQGPDQDRERTYKLAEKLSERLDEMGKDLTSMIEEINNASSTLSKTSKPDDPLSQVVRVLNSHLSQLQLIDQGAAALQAKVTAAQKTSQGLSTNGYSGHGSDAADDFYRSYMGRR
ncbi:MAG: hypothetical protein M1812_003607 [Candelaria pacifica]|nr:MAG: hypothetical protein M1812_003607 [Candelaria pacifica]